MMIKKKILFVFGTRPEAIKLAPLIQLIEKDGTFDSAVCVTGQHREMLQQVLDLFRIVPHYNLNVMTQNQDLALLTSNVIMGMTKILKEYEPDCVIVQGDTTTTMATALAAYYQKIDVGHVEAGLRTSNIYSPWPEEINRQAVARVARFHFAPTDQARKNLLQEGVVLKNIFITGNTVIDSLLQVRQGLTEKIGLQGDIFQEQFSFIQDDKKLILVTGHRRENFGEAFENVCLALKDVAAQENVQIVYPVHLNPNVLIPVRKILKNQDNVHLIDPLPYEPMAYLLTRSYLIVTDSGGIQEEAPALGIPVIVTRDTTERPEGVEAGTAILAGTDRKRIVSSITTLLRDEVVYEAMSKAHNPYGDGTASLKIVQILKQEL